MAQALRREHHAQRQCAVDIRLCVRGDLRLVLHLQYWYNQAQLEDIVMATISQLARFYAHSIDPHGSNREAVYDAWYLCIHGCGPASIEAIDPEGEADWHQLERRFRRAFRTAQRTRRRQPQSA